jgi:hypothetical protein
MLRFTSWLISIVVVTGCGAPNDPGHPGDGSCVGPSCALPDDTKADDWTGKGFWWLGAISTDPAVFANSGVRNTIDVAQYAPPGAGCMSYFTSETLDNGYWLQVGYGTCANNGIPPFTAFYQVWNVAQSPVVQLIDGETTVLSEGVHTFSAFVRAGTTWVFAVDDEPFGTADLGTATSDSTTKIETVVEKSAGIPSGYRPPAVHVPEAISVLHGGTWSPAAAAAIANNSGRSGVIGKNQDPSLAANEIVIGGTSPHLKPGIKLWNGAAVSPAHAHGTTGMPAVTITAPALGSTVSGTVTVAARVANAPAGSVDISDDTGATSCELTAPPYRCTWDTTSVDNGYHFLITHVYDASGNDLTWEYLAVDVEN